MNNKVFIEFLNSNRKDTLLDTLDIEFTEANKDEGWLKGCMPVNSKHHRPFGVLHGGATISLAESLGSSASVMYVDIDNEIPVGLELSANHVKSKKEGVVYGTAKIIHKGRTTHLWEIRIEDEEGKLISICKITNLIINKK